MGETTHTLGPRLSACTSTLLADPNAVALFLDMDGTLLELAPTPKSVRIPDGLLGLLTRLDGLLGGAVALITGRLISEADQILAPVRLVAAGVHGAEMRRSPVGDIERMTPVLADEVVQALRRIAARFPGVIAEPKGPGLALHYRLAPHAEPDLLAALQKYLSEHGAGTLELIPGKRLFEVIPAGLSKGTALAALAQLPAFRGRRPIMIGDDIGDEPAFAMAEAMQGFGLRVAGEHYRGEAADFSGPRAVLAWLDHVARRLQPAESTPVAIEG